MQQLLLHRRLAIQEQPFAAPLRLIAAGLKLHDPPLAMPPYQLEGASHQALAPGSKAHSTADAQGQYLSAFELGSCVTHGRLPAGKGPP